MKKLLQAKKIFVAKVDSVLNVQKDELDISTPCNVVPTSMGYRLLYKINDITYQDVLTGQKIKTYESFDIKKGDLIVGSYKRPLYRYSKSLRLGEYSDDVKKYALYVENFFNTPQFANNHDNFYKINELVRKCHESKDCNEVPLTKKELMLMLFGKGSKTADVDELYVIKTRIIDHVEKNKFNETISCDGHSYKYVLALRKWNGKYIDPLTNTEIPDLTENVKVGDIVLEKVRPLYRYAKSLRINEDMEDVKIYATFVKDFFNKDEYLKDHSNFYNINEIVRKCHNKNNINQNAEEKEF